MAALEEGKAEVEDDWEGQMDMQLRYYLRISQAELDAMSPTEWVRSWCHLHHVRKKESEAK